MIVAGDRWQVWQDSGPCATPQPVVGTYRWFFVGGVLAFALVEDPCPGRSDKVLASRLVRVTPPFPFGRYVGTDLLETHGSTVDGSIGTSPTAC